jgi:hypothetical protein
MLPAAALEMRVVASLGRWAERLARAARLARVARLVRAARVAA